MNFITSNYLEAIPESYIFAKIKLKNSKDMTKKRILLLCLTAMLSFSAISVYADSVDLQVGIVDPDYGDDGQHRGPVLIPDVCLDDYSLSFNTPCDGCTLRLLDENDVVAYSTVIPAGTISLVLPSYLSGEYEIQIIRGNIYFWGFILL